LNTVTLPEAGNGNNVPESAGASLVVIYRDSAQPLRKIVVYDGVHIQGSLTEDFVLPLQGFYKSSALQSAQITQIAASGQKNTRDEMFFNDGVNTLIASDPFPAAQTASDRAWASPTIDVSSLMSPGNNAGSGYGETATTTVSHSGGGAYDCLTWGAVVFSTAIADVDHDGIPDGLEDAAAGAPLKDPNGVTLPDLKAM